MWIPEKCRLLDRVLPKLRHYPPDQPSRRELALETLINITAVANGIYCRRLERTPDGSIRRLFKAGPINRVTAERFLTDRQCLSP